MTGTATVYVRLLSENVAGVWRPIQAALVEGDVYLIIAQPYDQEDELWEFGPGARVVCGPIQTSDGPILAAVRLADSPP